MREIKIGRIYKHFKDKYYVILDIVNDCEDVNNKIVIYKALYGDYKVWARNYGDFISEIDRVKYPEVIQKYRFEELKDINELKDYINNYNNELNIKINNLTDF